MTKIYCQFAIGFILLMVGLVCQCRAQSLEAAFTAGLRSGPRLEMGTSPFTFEDLLGSRKSLRIWAGAGSTVGESGNLAGSFAGLVGPFTLAKGLGVWPGGAVLGEEGKRPKFDAVVHFRASESKTVSFSFNPKAHSLAAMFTSRF